ncbi:MAG: response regulator [Gammaproteobacteria bacterium]
MLRVLLADDHPLFRAALRQAITQVAAETTFAEADHDAAVRQSMESCGDFDLVLLDLRMPGSDGFATLDWLRRQYPATAVVIISATEDAGVIARARASGAAGFCPKSLPLEALVAALRAVVVDCAEWFPAAGSGLPAHGPGNPLSERFASLTRQQFRVVELLAVGKRNKQIAAELGISEQTTKAHVSAAMVKLGARNRTQITLLFHEWRNATA